jgi:parallel beta-helix repeat protein
LGLRTERLYDRFNARDMEKLLAAMQEEVNVVSANDISDFGVENDAVWGILLAGSNNNTIRGSTIQRNGYAGIEVFGSSNNTIRANIANANGVYGILIFNSSSGHLIQGNQAFGNIAGIVVESRNGNVIKRYTALDNITDLADFNLDPGCQNVWKNNTFVTKDGTIACIE